MEFSAAHIAVVLECPVQHIAHMGQIVLPDGPANGSGHRAQYSFRNILEMMITERLRSFGVPQKRIQRYLAALRKAHNRWLEIDGPDEGWIVLDRVSRWAAGSTLAGAVEVLALTTPADALIAVDLGRLKQALRHKIVMDVFSD